MSLDHYKFYERNPQRRMRRDGTLEPKGAEMINTEASPEQKAVLRADGWLDRLAAEKLRNEIERIQGIVMSLQVSLGRYESAKLPEEPSPDGMKIEWMRDSYCARLRVYTAAATVRAEEARRKAIEECMKAAEDETCDQTEYACGTVSRIVDAIRALQEKE